MRYLKATPSHEVTLYGWIKRYYSIGSTKEVTNVDLLAELKRLQKENTRLKLEREILKKAAAYCFFFGS